MRFLLSLVAALLAAFAFPSQAELTRLEITSQRPFGSFRSGDYVLMEGKVQGEIASTEALPGLDKASRNARGRVEYSASSSSFRRTSQETHAHRRHSQSREGICAGSYALRATRAFQSGTFSRAGFPGIAASRRRGFGSWVGAELPLPRREELCRGRPDSRSCDDRSCATTSRMRSCGAPSLV
jgi:hypothetical protein